MKLVVVAVGQRVPDWAQVAWDDYAKRFPPELRVELKAVKTEPRASKSIDAIHAAERQRIEAAIPKGAHVVALDERGTALTTVALAQTPADERVFRAVHTNTNQDVQEIAVAMRTIGNLQNISVDESQRSISVVNAPPAAVAISSDGHLRESHREFGRDSINFSQDRWDPACEH